MTMIVGCSPGTVYTGHRTRAGQVSGRRHQGHIHGGKRQHLLCLVAASKNLVNGTVVTMDGTFTVTVAAIGGSTQRAAAGAIAICSIRHRRPPTSGASTRHLLGARHRRYSAQRPIDDGRHGRRARRCGDVGVGRARRHHADHHGNGRLRDRDAELSAVVGLSSHPDINYPRNQLGAAPMRPHFQRETRIMDENPTPATDKTDKTERPLRQSPAWTRASLQRPARARPKASCRRLAQQRDHQVPQELTAPGKTRDGKPSRWKAGA